MSGAYDDCGSDAYDDGQPRTLDLLSADYGDASQLTWYVGDDGLVHACAHNLLRSSISFELDGWSTAGSPTTVIDGPNLVSLLSTADRVYQNILGTSNRYQAVAGETLTLTCQVEAVSVTTAGTVFAQLSESGVAFTSSATPTLSAPGDTVQLSVTRTFTAVSAACTVVRADTFRGQVKVTNLCLSVGSETFPYIKTGETGARYMYRLPENLRRWSGTAYTTSKIVELNTGVTVNALVEGVGVTNLVINSGWTAAVVGDLASTGSPGASWADARNAQFTSDGGVMQVVATGATDGIPHIDLRITGTFTAAATTDISIISPSVAATGDVWTSSVLVELLDETDTGGYTETLLRLNEYATSSFLAVNGFKSISLAELQATSGPTSFSFTGTLGQATANAVGLQFRVVVGVGDVDMTIRVWCPMLTETSFVPQPILTYGSSVTRAAETPVTSDFAGLKVRDVTVDVRAIPAPAQNSAIFGHVFSIVEDSSNRIAVNIGDFDGDNDALIALNCIIAGSSTDTITSQLFTNGNVAALSGSYRYEDGRILAASKNVIMQTATASATAASKEFTVDQIQLAGQGAGNPVAVLPLNVALVHLNVATNLNQAVARAANLLP